MPLYEYRCPKCGSTQEQFRAIDDRDKQMLLHGTERHGPQWLERALTAPHLHGSPNMPNG